MSLDSQLRPGTNEDDKVPTENNNPNFRQNFSASLLGHGCVAGLGACVGSFYGLEVWQNGGSNLDYLRSMFYGAVIAGLFSLSFLEYRWKS